MNNLGIRMFAGMILMMTLSGWGIFAGYEHLPPLAKLSGHGFYAMAALMCIFGVIKGEAP